MKIVIARTVSDVTRQRIIEIFPREWEIVMVDAEELPYTLTDATAVIPEHAMIDGPLLDQAKHLKLVQTGAGFDNVDIDACTKRGVWAANASGVNAEAVAEHVLAFILCRCKNLLYLNEMMKKGEYGVAYSGSELSEKVIGIIGLGHIGKTVAHMAHAFNMKVLGYHYRSVDAAEYIEITDFENLLKRSDFVSVNTTLNDDTRHLIGRKALSLMKKDAFLINTSRGPVIDETALIAALSTNQIGGAGLDVYETEPLPQDSPLRKLDNVILTPHTAGGPDGQNFHKKRYEFFRENIRRVSEGKAPKKALNQIQ